MCSAVFKIRRHRIAAFQEMALPLPELLRRTQHGDAVWALLSDRQLIACACSCSALNGMVERWVARFLASCGAAAPDGLRSTTVLRLLTRSLPPVLVW